MKNSNNNNNNVNSKANKCASLAESSVHLLDSLASLMGMNKPSSLSREYEQEEILAPLKNDSKQEDDMSRECHKPLKSLEQVTFFGRFTIGEVDKEEDVSLLRRNLSHVIFQAQLNATCFWETKDQKYKRSLSFCNLFKFRIEARIKELEENYEELKKENELLRQELNEALKESINHQFEIKNKYSL